MKLYKRHFEGSYEKYSGMKHERLFEVTPEWIQVWHYEGEQPYQELFDLPNESYCREMYATDD